MGISWMDLLINPNRFFQQALGEKEQLTVPGLIVLASAIIAAAAGYFTGVITAGMLDSAMQGMGAIILIGTVIAAFIMTFVVWVVWAGVFYLISKIFKGTGSFSRCLEVVGYGYVPLVAGSLITLVAAFEYLPKVAIPTLTSTALQNPQLIQDATTALINDPAMVEFTQISAVISMVFLLWSANTWIFGIKQARNIPMRDAAICVGIPVILLIIYQLYKLAGL
ncbi:YIP1 family protein [Methanoregula sp.]|jgi:hypothetical protein|uniref:YIP1 family protein n=1 Tax=Methanoregula sp. TaxID=2052170 RepID=UPI003569A5EC